MKNSIPSNRRSNSGKRTKDNGRTNAKEKS